MKSMSCSRTPRIECSPGTEAERTNEKGMPHSEKTYYLSARFWVVRLAQPCRNAEPKENQQESEKHTYFGSNRSASQPSWTRASRSRGWNENMSFESMPLPASKVSEIAKYQSFDSGKLGLKRVLLLTVQLLTRSTPDFLTLSVETRKPLEKKSILRQELPIDSSSFP
jgi:hypothetical protein